VARGTYAGCGRELHSSGSNSRPVHICALVQDQCVFFLLKHEKLILQCVWSNRLSRWLKGWCFMMRQFPQRCLGYRSVVMTCRFRLDLRGRCEDAQRLPARFCSLKSTIIRTRLCSFVARRGVFYMSYEQFQAQFCVSMLRYYASEWPWGSRPNSTRNRLSWALSPRPYFV
jgi:hypothetical protein